MKYENNTRELMLKEPEKARLRTDEPAIQVDRRKTGAIDERHFEIALDASGTGLWDWNVETGEAYFNPRFYTMLGYEPYEMRPSYELWENLLHPDDKADAIQVVQETVIRDKKSLDIEYRLKTKSGTWRWISGKGSVVETDSRGKTLRIAGTHIDITKNKEIEHQLHRELQVNVAISELAHALISPAHDITKIANMVLRCAKKISGGRDGYVSTIDPKTGDNIGFVLTKECGKETTGSTPKKNMTVAKDSKGRYPGLRGHSLNTLKAFYTNSPKEHNACSGLPDHHPKFENFLSVPVMIADKLVGQIVLANADKDFTDWELRIVEHIGELYALALHHQKSDAEKLELQMQLRHTHKMQAIGTLAGGITHDFNNILSPIVGYTELAISSLAKDRKERAYLKEVLKATDRAENLVKQILYFGHKGPDKRSPIKLQPVINDVLRLLRSTLPASIEIRQLLYASCGPTMADPTQIHQIIINLCTNAHHAMEGAGGTIEVRLDEVDISADNAKEHNELELGKYLRMTVEDTGEGMDSSVLERIFDPYFTTKEQDKGTGLGLSIAHGIAKHCGGDIEVESEPGKGSSFHVYLPRTAEICHIEHDKPTPVSLQKGDEHILLVDDEESIVGVEKLVLKALGYRITNSTSSPDAVELFRKHPEEFDLVITDQSMPKMTGLELAKNMIRIRPDIPIILRTGLVNSDLEKKAKEIGIRKVLGKPLTQSRISKGIRDVLNAFG
jgi:PAS domain S-box-containing protein